MYYIVLVSISFILLFDMNSISNLLLIALVCIYAEASLLSRASKALCPIIGYNGSFCPLPRSELRPASRNMQQLISSGVGITVDLSTGMIKLPALQFTDRETAIAINEVIITVNNGTENPEPNIHIFRTERDSIKIWQQTDDNSWFGGEFGHAKDILYMYETFFAKNQAPAILQQLYPMYTLTVRSTNITHLLNQYAQEALSSLPTMYDAKSYTAFLDMWGTHIAVQTKLGGMREQQVLMKNCILDSDHFTNGLADTELRWQLKRTLLSPTESHDEYFEQRHKVLRERRFGGTVDIADLEEWRKTISSNLALLNIEKSVPWFEVVQNPLVRSNLKVAIIDRIDSAAAARIAAADQVDQQKLATRFLQRSAHAIVGHGPLGADSASWEIGNQIMLKDAGECPVDLSLAESKEKCNTGTYITSWNTIELTEPLRYERDPMTGSFRSIRVRDIVNGQSKLRARFLYSLINNALLFRCKTCSVLAHGSNRVAHYCQQYGQI